ncbi:MAG TPA: hypothetical protein VFM18_20800, partial [Methanosarcina sp.]|nr:hypothetical protein [Methanosarcina sp.]
TYNLPALAAPFDSTKSNYAAPTTAQSANGWLDNVDVILAEQQNYLHNTTTTYLWLVQQLGLAMPFNPDGGGASLVATPSGGIVSIKNSSTGATEFYIAKNNRAIGYTDPSLDPTNWVMFNVSALAQFTGFYATAGGTVDAITASYTVPYPVLVNGYTLDVRVSGGNATTTPTFAPTLNGSAQTARTIVKVVNNSVVALAAGDLNGVAQLRYDLANTRWILLNPALANASVLNSVNVTGSAIVTGAITSASPSLGVGYAAGAGGAVTQTVSISNPVTINKLSGAITTVSVALTANTPVFFNVFNSTVAAGDVVIINVVDLALINPPTSMFVAKAKIISGAGFEVSLTYEAPSGTLSATSYVMNFAIFRAVSV